MPGEAGGALISTRALILNVESRKSEIKPLNIRTEVVKVWGVFVGN